jgi:hypothetical protein
LVFVDADHEEPRSGDEEGEQDDGCDGGEVKGRGMSADKKDCADHFGEVTSGGAGEPWRGQSDGTHARADGDDVAADEDGGSDEPENEPLKAEGAKRLTSDERKAAGHENRSEAGEHVDGAVFVGRAAEDDLVIDRHGDEDQSGKGGGAAADHDKKIFPLLRHRHSVTRVV